MGISLNLLLNSDKYYLIVVNKIYTINYKLN